MTDLTKAQVEAIGRAQAKYRDALRGAADRLREVFFPTIRPPNPLAAQFEIAALLGAAVELAAATGQDDHLVATFLAQTGGRIVEVSDAPERLTGSDVDTTHEEEPAPEATHPEDPTKTH